MGLARLLTAGMVLIIVSGTTDAALGDDYRLEDPTLVASPVDDADHNTYGWPDWSIDDRIVFEAQLEGHPNHWELITCDLNGGKRHTIPYDWENNISWGLPHFSRNGARIMGHTTRNLDHGFLVNADGTDLEVLDIDGIAPEVWPTALLRPGPDPEQGLIGSSEGLYRVDLETRTLVWASEPFLNRGGDWSPNGSLIVAAYGGANLWLVDAATGDLREPIASGSTYSMFPSWSPDGTRFLFSSKSGLHVVRTDGSGFSTLVVGPDTMARWCPDGHSIVYASNDEIWRASVVPEPASLRVPVKAPPPLRGEGTARDESRTMRPSTSPSMPGREVVLGALMLACLAGVLATRRHR